MLAEKADNLERDTAITERIIRTLPGGLRTSVAMNGGAMVHLDARCALHLARTLESAETVRGDCVELAGYLRDSVAKERYWRGAAWANGIAALTAMACFLVAILMGY